MSVEILNGDCTFVLGLLPDDSADSCVTDPPYHLTSVVERFGKPGSAPAQSKQSGVYARSSAGFMGQQWDGGDIAFRPETWAEVLRVLKPGGYLLAFGGTRTYHRLACAIEDAGFEIRDMIEWIYGTGFPKSKNIGDGRGTALKPAQEPIAVARKPLVGTVAANVERYGTGALNIDACRVGADDGANRAPPPRTANTILGGGKGTNLTASPHNDVGRWPANLIHDGSDEVLACFPESKGQQRSVGPEHGPKPSVNTYGDFGPRETFAPRGDSGSAARFFYCAKASRSDRNDGLGEDFDEKPLNWSSGEQSPGTFQSAGTKKAAKNNHPTVKPTNLMRYLCRLVTPPGGTVLDPFMGSGSTGRGAVLEGFNFIGIEQSAEYVEIAKARIKAAQK